MNNPNRVQLLAESLRESARKAQEEQDQVKQVERIAAAVRAKLTHIHASDDDLFCPSCGYKGPESDFEPDDDDDSDGYRTDDVTSVADGNEDEDNEGDRELDAKGKSGVVAEILARKRRR